MTRTGLCTTALAAFVGLLAMAGPADAAPRDVETWVTGELADYVYDQLMRSPRFADASVHFVVFEHGQPASRGSQLALTLRDTLRRNLAGRNGVRLGWQPDPAAPLQQLPVTAEQCDAMRPELLIGIEVRAGAETATASVRALDEAEHRWVPGFGRDWQGRLDAAQQKALAMRAPDRSYLGERDVPYGPTESDLIASHLARDLRCQLMRQVSGEYRLGLVESPADGGALDVVPALVRHQVGGLSALRLLSSPDGANAQLAGELHAVAGGLHQYWLVLDPIGSDDGLQPLSSSVYVEIAATAPVSGTAARVEPAIPAPAVDLLSDMRVVWLSGDGVCLHRESAPSLQRRIPAAGRCAALKITAVSDAVVFILNHQRNLGLVRLDDERCAPRPRAHILRRGQSMTIPVPDLVPVDGAQWSAVSAWSPAPGGEVFYAIASTDSDAARAIAKHLATLPARCSDAIRPGLDDAALAQWLQSLAAELERRAPDVSWRAVQTRNVY